MSEVEFAIATTRRWCETREAQMSGERLDGMALQADLASRGAEVSLEMCQDAAANGWAAALQVAAEALGRAVG